MSSGVAGIAVLNAVFLLAGVAVLAGIRGWRSWLEVVDLLGVAFVLGLSVMSLLATLVLVAGGGLSTTTIACLAGAVCAAGAILARLARRPLPRRAGALPRPTPAAAVAAALGIVTVVTLVAFARVAHVTPLQGGDSWEFWVPKAKIIYFDGGIDHSPLFTTLAGPSYPLLVPALLAMDFRFMGSAFAPVLAAQYWLLLVGFVFAAAALLRRLVPAWIAWLFLALATTLPNLDQRFLGAQADWTLDVLLGLTALFLVGWLQRREGWLLAGFGVLLAATIATKREGALFAACLLAGALAANARAWRTKLLPVAGVAAAAYLVNVPWQLWWTTRHLPAESPPGGGVHELVANLDRGWSSLGLVLRLLFDEQQWLILVPIALIAALTSITIVGQARENAILYLTTAVLLVASYTWILWSDPSLPLNEQQSSTPIPRAVGSLVVISTVLAPLLIAPLLADRTGSLRHSRARVSLDRDEPAAPAA